jgi:predicted nucleic acid-binding Zn ribbon protein
MSNTSRRGPRELSEILTELFTARGYGRLRALSELENAWNNAVGEPHCQQTRLGEIRRGVITVTVAHPTLLEELAAFRKAELLAALRACGPGSAIQDIRFRVGSVESGPEPAPGRPGPEGAGPGSRDGRRGATDARRGRRPGSKARKPGRDDPGSGA